MSFVLGRKGNISLVRVGTILAVLGVAIAIGGFVIFNFERNGYKKPLNIELFPSATDWGEQSTGRPNQRTLLYRVQGVTPEEVVAFYDQKMIDHYDTSADDPDRESCNRYPREDENNGIFSDYEEGAGTVPYYFLCEFSQTGFNVFRSTTVKIQPGVRNDETGQDNTGSVVIVYEQYWQP